MQVLNSFRLIFKASVLFHQLASNLFLRLDLQSWTELNGIANPHLTLIPPPPPHEIKAEAVELKKICRFPIFDLRGGEV